MANPDLNIAFHRSATTAVTALISLLACAWVPGADKPKDDKLWYTEPQPRFAKTDLGRVFSGSIELRGTGQRHTAKAIAIRVGDTLEPGATATVIFDTELLRASAAIPNRGVMFNTYRDGLGGSGHWVGPPYLFTTSPEPGWAHGTDFSDPRSKPVGSLPRDHAHYQGLYRHGTRAVLSYTVGQTRVLEAPWIETKGNIQTVTRTFQIQSAAEPLYLNVLHADTTRVESASQAKDRNTFILKRDNIITAAGVVPSKDMTESPSFSLQEGGRVVLKVPPGKDSTLFKVLLWSGEASQLPAWNALLNASAAPERLDSLTQPGPPQWTESIVTEGNLGNSKGPYVVDNIAPPYTNPYKALMTFGGHDFFSNGDAALCTIHGDVWRVTGLEGDLLNLHWIRYATGLFQPLGLKIVQDKIYVLGRDQITRLHDNNGDSQADYYENFNNDCKIGDNVHEFATSLETDPQGNFYYSKGTNDGQTEHDGTLVRISPDGSRFEIFATGFRWPNGAGAGPDGTITVADQQGNWVPSSRLDVIKQGGFYGYMPTHHRPKKPDLYDGPLCWIPHEVDNSCGGQTWVTGNRWGPLDGHMLHLSYGQCTLFLVLEQSVDGVRQGGIVPLDVKFQSGAMRARFNPKDGQLYVTGLKGWQTSAIKDGCFQRVRYTGKPVRMPIGLHAHKNGLRIQFVEPLDKATAIQPDNWNVERWNYRWTPEYGSKDYKVSDPQKSGRDSMEIRKVQISEDGKEVFLEVPDLAPVMQMKVKYNLNGKDGQKLSGYITHTIHRLAPPPKD